MITEKENTKSALKILELHRKLHQQLSLIPGPHVKKTDVIRIVDETFAEYGSKREYAILDNIAEKRITLLKDHSFTEKLDGNMAVGFRILSDYLNYDVPLTGRITRETAKNPLGKTESDCYRYACEDTPNSLGWALRILDTCEFKPNCNEYTALKDIVARYAKKTGIDLSKIEPDYDLLLEKDACFER